MLLMGQAAPAAQTLETSECSISYRDVGEGPPVLLLHGGGPGATGWGNFAANTLDLQARFRVFVPDQPGFGASRVSKDSGASYHTLSAHAMAEFLSALGIERAHVVGNSMGGGVALRLALQHPELVDRVVLMGPWLPGFGIPLLAPRPIPLLQEYYPNPTREKMELLIRAFVFEPRFEDFDGLVTSRYEASLDPVIREGYARMSQGRDPNPDPRPIFEQLAGISQEILLLWGRDDRFCSLDDAFMYLAALPKSRLIIFRDCGHWVQVERRHDFGVHVSAFLVG
jgi:pimeloyl-ACP methyl ester carboxylesterase